MSKSLKYVKDFDFSSAGKTVGYCGGGMVEKGYARGGEARLKDTIRNERQELNRVSAKQRDAGREISRVRSEMRYDKNELKNARNAPQLPGQTMLKKGGPVIPKAGYKKIDKVMTEFKSGKLHSGSKSGPEVTNPKQAVAIALSEARRADKKSK